MNSRDLYEMEPQELREEVERLRAENLHQRSLLGLSPNTTVLQEYRRLDSMWQALVRERDQARFLVRWFEDRSVFFEKLTETVDRTPVNPSYLHAILEGLRLWDSEHPKP